MNEQSEPIIPPIPPDRPEKEPASAYLGVEGTRPYAGAGWYYAEYRDRVSAELITLLAEQLGWSTRDRILDVGAGPGQLSLLVAPFVAEVVAIEPEPDMLAEGERRAATADIGNVRFVAGSSDDLPALLSYLGQFRAALMGQSFHWMVDKDRVLENLSAMIDEDDGAVAFVTPRRVSIPDELRAAQDVAQEILERHLGNVPPGPHPSGRHDPFDEILRRSPFPRIERIERIYESRLRPTIEAILGHEYSISHVLTRLGENRWAFEREACAALSRINRVEEVSVTRRDEALIGRR
ncbi:MAG: methyltransferase domain-containing protein [Chloracidobacterium sp.]|nr:methyltransferase domain-containing protein [Chloracidobacterium sp.]